jgi:hypothetical protein
VLDDGADRAGMPARFVAELDTAEERLMLSCSTTGIDDRSCSFDEPVRGDRIGARAADAQWAQASMTPRPR